MSLSRAGRLCSALLAAVLFSGCATANHPGDRWFSRDKAYHFAVASALGAGATAAADGNDAAPVIGVGVAMSFGVGKELYDRDVQKEYWSWKDLAWDLAGAVAGAAAATAAKP